MVRFAAVLAGCAVAACILGDCTVPRSNLGTTDSSCYLALPAATRAVGPHGRLLGLHLLRLNSLSQKSKRLFEALPPEHTSRQRVCVIEFEGNFTRLSVARPFGQMSGHLAVVVLSAPSNHLVGTVLFEHAPLQFGHSHIG
jgi:hypothetical protein